MLIKAVSRKTIDEAKRLKAILNEKSGLYSVDLERVEVIFADTDADNRLGYYERRQKLIVLSHDLIIQSSREDLDSVFLHEAAHAIDDALRGFTEHDQAFRNICRTIGVPDGFEKSKVKLRSEKRARIQDKVNKLLRLSESPFENESSEALLKAQRLMAEYGIREGNESDEMLYYATIMSSKKFFYHEKIFFSIISKLSGAYIIREKQENGEFLANAYGTVDQVVFAYESFEYLEKEIRSAYFKAVSASRTFIDRNSFFIGLSSALYERLSDDEEESISKALMTSYSGNAAKYRQIYSGARIRKTRSRTTYSSQSSFRKGEKAASDINIERAGKDAKVKKIEYRKK